jgi:hypothetical protein
MAARTFAQETIRQSFLEESAYLRVSSPLFSVLAKACAEDAEIVRMCAIARPGQPVGALFLCVGQYLLFKSPQAEAARYFPALTTSPAPAEGAFPSFRAFCMEHRESFGELLATRTVNTNLVEKASSLLPAVRHVSKLAGGPLTLLEICCSAGMNLMFDQYHYDYGSCGRVGPEDSAVHLKCKIVGSSSPPVDAIPHIAERVGVDLVRMDPSSADHRLWMEAVLYPEWTMERQNLRSALEIRVSRGLRTVIGDALDVVPALLEELPGSLCVLLSHCLGQWPESSRIALHELFRKASRQRNIHRLDIELLHDDPPQSVRGRMLKLAAAGIPFGQKSFPSRIEHTAYVDGNAKSQLVGQGDSFGVWLDWYGAPQ